MILEGTQEKNRARLNKQTLAQHSKARSHSPLNAEERWLHKVVGDRPCAAVDYHRHRCAGHGLAKCAFLTVRDGKEGGSRRRPRHRRIVRQPCPEAACIIITGPSI